MNKNIRNTFLYEIFNWNPAWLSDEQYNESLPTIINDVKLLPAQLQYQNVEEYKNVMFPMLIHEFWHVLKDDFREFQKKKKKTEVLVEKLSETSREIISVDNSRNKKICSFKVEAHVKIRRSERSNNPRRGDLVFLGKSKATEKNSTFAYISEVKERYGGSLLTYTLITNVSGEDVRSPISLTSFSFLMGYLSLVDALDHLSEFPLYESVLCPDVESYQIPIDQELDLSSLKTKQDLNSTQSKIIAGLLEAVTNSKSKILLVQGPPGTGKSMTIVNLVTMIRQLRKKILLCAPSNKAIDSVVLRLLDVQDTLREQGVVLNIVRVGDKKKMDVKVKKISLQHKANSLREPYYRTMYSKKQDILQNANIIASTLASCYTSNIMTNLYGLDPFDKSSLGICIVDEAAQATELLTLVPCLLGIKKLILVGDPQQLKPIILSEQAKDHGYDTSIFYRAKKIFDDQEINPIVMLDTQYRMTKAISKWPNSFFYNGALTDAAIVNPLGICNYKLFNHDFLQDEIGHSNVQEAELVVKLIKLLREKLNLKESSKITIGVITPYHKQRQVIENMLYPGKLKKNKISNIIDEKLVVEPENEDLTDKNKAENSSDDEDSEKDTTIELEDDVLCDIFDELGLDNGLDSQSKTSQDKKTEIIEEDKIIEINTVDSFQGSERDIIIMSCVRSSGIGFTKDPNRLCVSLTRAKHTLIMFGNFNAFRGNEMWCSLINDAAERNVFVNIGDSDAESVLNKHVIDDN